MSRRPLAALLFDLDGTLVDTAPDLAYALNTLLEEEGERPLPLSEIRPHVSHGTTALLRHGFGITPEEERFPHLRQRILDLYRDNISRQSTLFPGIEPLLTKMEAAQLPWGVVTNKPAFLTEPLLRALHLSPRMAAIVSGDTLPQAKPHPAPLLYACEKMGVSPVNTLYIGDAQRDIEAGKAAGMETIAAGWGYIEATTVIGEWGADTIVHSTSELFSLLSPRLSPGRVVDAKDHPAVTDA
ncbi:MAG: phosphoglycolate phosphatase [Gammaproteobacteria bacterium]|nr:phosphoglycolate phosphatase [Gammaproteobacteria bacterium]